MSARASTSGCHQASLTCRSRLKGFYERFGFKRLDERDYPPHFARRMPMINVFLRPFGIRIIVMRRDAAD